MRLVEVLTTFPVAVTKSLDKSNLREKGFVWDKF